MEKTISKFILVLLFLLVSVLAIKSMIRNRTLLSTIDFLRTLNQSYQDSIPKYIRITDSLKIVLRNRIWLYPGDTVVSKRRVKSWLNSIQFWKNAYEVATSQIVEYPLDSATSAILKGRVSIKEVQVFGKKQDSVLISVVKPGDSIGTDYVKGGVYKIKRIYALSNDVYMESFKPPSKIRLTGDISGSLLFGDWRFKNVSGVELRGRFGLKAGGCLLLPTIRVWSDTSHVIKKEIGIGIGYGF